MTARETPAAEALEKAALRFVKIMARACDRVRPIRGRDEVAVGTPDWHALMDLAPRLHALASTSAPGWRPISEAPYDTVVEVRAGRMTFLARLLPDAAMSTAEEVCDQWAAEIEGEHPPCWSDGACWTSNENEVASLPPSAWRLPTPPSAEDTDHG